MGEAQSLCGTGSCRFAWPSTCMLTFLWRSLLKRTTVADPHAMAAAACLASCVHACICAASALHSQRAWRLLADLANSLLHPLLDSCHLAEKVVLHLKAIVPAHHRSRMLAQSPASNMLYMLTRSHHKPDRLSDCECPSPHGLQQRLCGRHCSSQLAACQQSSSLTCVTRGSAGAVPIPCTH